MPVHLHFVSGCLYTRTENWVVVTETIWATEPEIFAVWPFMEKVTTSGLE